MKIRVALPKKQILILILFSIVTYLNPFINIHAVARTKILIIAPDTETFVSQVNKIDSGYLDKIYSKKSADNIEKAFNRFIPGFNIIKIQGNVVDNAFYRYIKDQFIDLNPGDSFLVYINSHGFVPVNEKDLYIIASNTRLSLPNKKIDLNNLDKYSLSGYVSREKIVKILKGEDCTKVDEMKKIAGIKCFLFVDTCFGNLKKRQGAVSIIPSTDFYYGVSKNLTYSTINGSDFSYAINLFSKNIYDKLKKRDVVPKKISLIDLIKEVAQIAQKSLSTSFDIPKNITNKYKELIIWEPVSKKIFFNFEEIKHLLEYRNPIFNIKYQNGKHKKIVGYDNVCDFFSNSKNISKPVKIKIIFPNAHIANKSEFRDNYGNLYKVDDKNQLYVERKIEPESPYALVNLNPSKRLVLKPPKKHNQPVPSYKPESPAKQQKTIFTMENINFKKEAPLMIKNNQQVVNEKLNDKPIETIETFTENIYNETSIEINSQNKYKINIVQRIKPVAKYGVKVDGCLSLNGKLFNLINIEKSSDADTFEVLWSYPENSHEAGKALIHKVFFSNKDQPETSKYVVIFSKINELKIKNIRSGKLYTISYPNEKVIAEFNNIIDIEEGLYDTLLEISFITRNNENWKKYSLNYVKLTKSQQEPICRNKVLNTSGIKPISTTICGTNRLLVAYQRKDKNSDNSGLIRYKIENNDIVKVGNNISLRYKITGKVLYFHDKNIAGLITIGQKNKKTQVNYIKNNIWGHTNSINQEIITTHEGHSILKPQISTKSFEGINIFYLAVILQNKNNDEIYLSYHELDTSNNRFETKISQPIQLNIKGKEYIYVNLIAPEGANNNYFVISGNSISIYEYKPFPLTTKWLLNKTPLFKSNSFTYINNTMYTWNYPSLYKMNDGSYRMFLKLGLSTKEGRFYQTRIFDFVPGNINNIYDNPELIEIENY